jgi:hypothetical protein
VSTPDLSRWTRRGSLVERDDGAREHVLVGRHRFATHASLSSRSSALATDASSAPRVEGRAVPEGALVVEGVASSTSVDSYGTEMSLDALRRMAEQMERGLPLLPRHNNGMRAVEWDEVIGRTVGAKVEAASVAAPGGANEPGYSLSLVSMLYPDEPLAMTLVRRLERMEPIGQSIGGWFLSVRVVERGGEVERIIVEEIELDHVAVTRAPANPDAVGMVSLRSSLAASLAALPEQQRNGDHGDEGGSGTVEVKVVVEADEQEEEPDTEEALVVEGAACPAATGSASVNLANRAKAIEVANYGPANPEEPGDYWKAKAERLGGETTEEQAGRMRCSNCSYFNVSARLKACIAAGIGDDGAQIVENAGLGFCEAFDFKCAGARTCDGWVVGGPMVEEAPSEEQAAARRLASGSARANPAEVREGDFVRFLAPDGVEAGQIKARAVEGDLDGVQASEEDPALRVEVYDREGDGYVPSGRTKAVLASKVERIDPLPLPSTSAVVDVAYFDQRATVPFSDFPPAPRDEPWVWGADEQNAVLGDPPEWDRYESAHLYVDPEQRETKAGYKLPVAALYDGSLRVFYRAVVAAMAVLNGARGGIEVSDADRRGIYENLVRYYRVFDEEAPPLAERVAEEEGRSGGRAPRLVRVERAGGLDVTGGTVHDTLNHAAGSPDGIEARAGSDLLSTLPHEDNMSDNDVKKMIERAVAEALASRGAPAPEPVDETTRLKGEVAHLRSMVDRLAAAPVRRGLAYQTGEVTGGKVHGRSALHDLVERSRASSPGLAQVIEATLPALVGDKAERATASELHSVLATALRAAEAEGLLGNPAPAHWA